MALFSAYRADQYADPEGFKNSLGAVLESFPNEVIMFVCDPRTGIQRRLKWPPALSEVIEACEEHQDFLRRSSTQRPMDQRRLAPPDDMRDRPQGCLANLFVPEGHARYAQMVEWTKDNEPKWWKYGNSSDGRRGIWVPLFVWNGGDVKSLNRGA